MSAGRRFLDGARMGVPIIFGFIPVGIAFAIAARGAGFTVLETCLMSLSVFAGASQMMAAGMYAESAGILAIVAATLIINLRHIIMSTCVMRRMKDAPLGMRLLMAFGVTDESFAVFSGVDEARATPAFFLGLASVSYASWNVGTLLGALGADLLPEVLMMAFGVALYAMFISILAPGLRGNLRLVVLVALTAALNSVLSMFIDGTWSLVITTLLGAFCGVFFVELDDGKSDTPPIEDAKGADSAARGGEGGAEC